MQKNHFSSEKWFFYVSSIKPIHDQRDDIRNQAGGDCQHDHMVTWNVSGDNWIQKINDDADQDAGDNFFHDG
jgi:hypothetical protein